jgi:hypothetical protein
MWEIGSRSDISAHNQERHTMRKNRAALLLVALIPVAALATYFLLRHNPREGAGRDTNSNVAQYQKEKVRLLLPYTMQAQFAGPVVAAKPGGAYQREQLAVEIEPGVFLSTPLRRWHKAPPSLV